MLHYIRAFPNTGSPVKPKMLSEKPLIHPTAIIRDSHIGSWTEIGPDTHIEESILDDYSYTAGDISMVYTGVGKFCSIASHVRINPGNHPVERVTQHHCTYRRRQYGFVDTDDETVFNWRRAKRCTIGHDVWIGHGAIILAGVNIGTGATIGAGAVVTKDVSPYVIVVGVPAKIIRKRFSDEIIEKLLRVAWWDWDRKRLRERFNDFMDVDIFLEKYHG